jgi:hypothetical protein
MKQLGWTECDVVELDLSDLDATALGIALNRSAELADWDEGALAEILSTLKDEGALDGVGFDEVEIDELLADIEDIEVEQDEVPEPPAVATTRPGDLWVLGRHRLLCGDSASAQDVDRLLGDASIHLVNTDPPYNVKVEPRSNNAIAAGLSSFTTPTCKAATPAARTSTSIRSLGAGTTSARPRPCSARATRAPCCRASSTSTGSRA